MFNGSTSGFSFFSVESENAVLNKSIKNPFTPYFCILKVELSYFV